MPSRYDALPAGFPTFLTVGLSLHQEQQSIHSFERIK